MKNTINEVIVSFRRLSLEYNRISDIPLQIDERENIPIEILKQVCYLCIPDEKLQGRDAQNEIEKILRNEFVMSEDETSEFVNICGYEDDKFRSIDDSIFFLTWCLFKYTCMLSEQDQKERNEFLWVSILFPYIYKLNTFTSGNRKSNKVCKELLQESLDKYPLESKYEKPSEIFKEFDSKVKKDEAYLSEMLNKKDNLGTEMKEALIDRAVMKCKQGITVAVHMSSKKVGERKDGEKDRFLRK